jgi:hypothetical protein
MPGLLDMQTFTPGAAYMTPEQRNQARTVGLLGMASQLFDLSAPRKNELPATPFQLLGGAAKGFSSGVSGFMDETAQRKKQDMEMLQLQAWDDYAQKPETGASLGLPQGVPVTADMVQKILVGKAEAEAKRNPLDDLYRQSQITAMQALANQRNADAAQPSGGGTGGAKAAPSGYRWKPDGTLEAVPGGPQDPANQPAAKRGDRLPSSVQGIQDDAVNASNTALMASKDALALADKIDKGQLNLGPIANVESIARNWAGMSSPNSMAYQDLNSLKERLINATLLLAKGVQTEGDAQRALNELFANTNDEKIVGSRLRQIAEMNKLNAALMRQKVDNLRSDVGFGSYNFSGFDQILSQPSPFAAPAEQGAGTLPRQGEVVDGYEYIGGSPSSPSSWRATQ